MSDRKKDTQSESNERSGRPRTKAPALHPLTRTFAASRYTDDAASASHIATRPSSRSQDGGGSQEEIVTRSGIQENSEASAINLTRVPALTTRSSTIIQPHLTVNTPGDSYEQEAEQVADGVMSMPSDPLFDMGGMIDTPATATPASRISRLPSGADHGGAVSPDVESNINQMRGSGETLSETENDFFSSRMGYDFSGVRLHTGSNAIQASRDVSARAFTFGNNIAFNAGEYQPGTDQGRRLLAHELTHVVQQGAAPQSQTRSIQRSMVMNHLQTLQRQPGFDASVYRKEIADFQRSNPTSSIRSKQTELLQHLETEATSVQKKDSSQTLRRCAQAPSTTARRGQVKSGPTYSPNGALTPTNSGGRLSKTFNFTAEFEHDPANGIYASCCEVRQYIKWDSLDVYPAHPGFGAVGSLPINTWVEDRDSADKRYGHRSGTHSDPGNGDQYTDSSGTQDQANGIKYSGRDTPGVPAATFAGKGKWYFMVKVIDTANGNAQLGSADTLTITW